MLLTPDACHGPWDAADARFRPCAFPILAGIPLGFIFLILLSRMFGRFLSSWRPAWTKPFVKANVSPPIELESPKSSVSWYTIASATIAAAGVAAHLLLLTVKERRIESVLLTVSWAAVMIFFLCFRPVRFPPSMSAYYLSVILYDYAIVTGLDSPSRFLAVLYSISFFSCFLGLGVLLLMPINPPTYDAQNIGRVGAPSTSEFRSPEDAVRLWQWLTVSWLSPLISVGKTRLINESDVWALPLSFQHGRLVEGMKLLRGSLLRRVIRANAIDIILLCIMSFFDMVCDFATPLLLRQLLKAMENGASIRVPMTYACLIFGCRLLEMESTVVMLWYGRRCYERSRGEMIMMVYDKALKRKNVIGTQGGSDAPQENGAGLPAVQKHKRSKTQKPPASMGKVLNLVRGDVYEVAQRFWEVDKLIKIPVRAVLSVWIIWSLLGPSCFLAVLVVFTAQCLSAIIARIIVAWSRRYKAAKDARLQRTSQFIEVIRHLRWYNWQDHWLKDVLTARDYELKIHVQTELWAVLMGAVNNFAGFFFPVAALGAYALLGENKLSVDVIFPALALFNIMTQQIQLIPNIINDLANAFVSAKRIDDFMNEPEKETSQYSDAAVEGIKLVDSTFAWPETKAAVLMNINLEFYPGLNLIYGTVGSGKTALLQALLGEMDELAGTRRFPDTPIGYCSQTPWLQSMSIRENILFNSHFDEARYWKTLDACELLPDLDQFSHGDRSFIGENGIGLSGGQKARVALARAVYSRADILLLDDPLSALDHNTAENIVRKLFAGPLVQGRTVILATHRVGLVQKQADQIIEISNGNARTIDNGQLSHLQGVSDDSDSQTDVEQTSNDEPEYNGKPKRFVEEEHRAEWGVKFQVYWAYVRAGRFGWWFLIALMLGSHRIVLIYRTWFLKTWGEAYPREAVANWYSSFQMILSPISTTAIPGDPLSRLPNPVEDVAPWLIAFAVIAVLMQLTLTIQSLAETMATYCAGRSLFRDAMAYVTNASFRFYDVTPVGRLMNRMTSDITAVDSTITRNIVFIVVFFFSWVSAVVVIASVTPMFLVFTTVLVAAMVATFLHFLPLSQNLRRLEMTSLSPLFANFGELLHGLTTVRAFKVEKQFQDRITTVVDTFQGMDHFFWSLQAWLIHRCRTLSGLSEFALTSLALYSGLTPGLTAFMLIAAEQFVSATFGLCQKYGTLMMEFISVERVHELLGIEQEPRGNEPPASWPKFGADVEFRNVTIRYAAHFDPALHNISLAIPGGSTTAVLGRTGSGKSTLASALLNVVRPESGEILIDGITLSSVDPKILRSRLTYIPQDPALFSGSIRHNLDPQKDFTNEECDVALQRVCGRHGFSLDTQVESGGKNLSHGQRQLICIARAVLRRSSIVILDEATASIDFEGSMEIQGVLREEMRSSTVITIAHRLEAVKDADYCVVLENGRLQSQGRATDVS